MNAKAGGVGLGGQGASWGLFSPHTAPQMPPVPETWAQANKRFNPLFRCLLSLGLKAAVALSSTRWLEGGRDGERDGMGRVAAAQATHTLPAFLFCAPTPPKQGCSGF